MPIYEYKCNNCDYEVDVLEKKPSRNAQECPECKQITLERRFSVPNVQFKGAGWTPTYYG